jgi:TRAP-type C4-dicarboxylate transport system substrate-binding protein
MGTIDMACGYVPDSLDSRFGVISCPFLTTDYEEAKKIYAPDGYLNTEFNKLLDAKGVKFLGSFFEGYVGMGTMKEPQDVFVPGANKKIQIRVWAAPASRDPMEDLGYTAITVPYAEVPTALQTGVAEGWIGGTPNINYHWVGEVIKYYYETRMNAEMSAYTINKDVFEKLTLEDQKILTELCAKYSSKSFDMAQAEDEKWMSEMEENGVKIIRFNEEDMKANIEYVRTNTWPKLEDLFTKELLDGVKAEY